MKKLLVIDGYNCMRRAGTFEAALDRSLESARDAFVGYVRGYRARNAAFGEVIIVFDGTGNRGLAKAQKDGGVTIIFSRFGESADEAIKLFVGRNINSHKITVVSDDNYVTNNARAYGAEVLSCRGFMKTAEPRRKARPNGLDEKAIDAGTADKINEELKREWRIKGC